MIKALIFFASTHLAILAFHAMRSKEWEVLSMASIMDISYLYSNPSFIYVIEGGLWIALVLLLIFLWFSEKKA